MLILAVLASSMILEEMFHMVKLVEECHTKARCLSLTHNCLICSVLVSLAPDPYLFYAFSSNEGAQILISYEYFTDLSSLAEKKLLLSDINR